MVAQTQKLIIMLYTTIVEGEEYQIGFTPEDIHKLKQGLTKLCCDKDSIDEVPFAWVRMTKCIFDNDKDNWMTSSAKYYAIESVKFINKLLELAGEKNLVL